MILHHLKQAHGLNKNSTVGSLMSVHYSSCEVDVTPQQDQYLELQFCRLTESKLLQKGLIPYSAKIFAGTPVIIDTEGP